jgi:hypothetical protein
VAATIAPPAGPSREELTKSVTDLTAKLSQAVEASTRSATPDVNARLGQLFDGLAQAEKLIPRDHFDPDAIVAAVGNDPTALARWVKDRTLLVPYHGTLRGPVGVLMDRVGNSLDRALLLCELLRAAGQQSRLARARLSGTELDTVVAATGKEPVGETATGAASANANDILAQAGIDPAALASQQAALRQASQQLDDGVKARVKGQTATLLNVLKPYVVSSSTDDVAWQREALADHWWVQYRDGASWTDLDPLPGGDSIGALVIPASTIAVGGLPNALSHRVRVRVVTEFWKDGTLRAVPVFDFVFTPSQWIGQPVTLRSIPADWPDSQKLLGAPDRSKAIVDAARAQHEWIPVLTFGNKPAFKNSFTDDGQIHNVSNPNALTMRLGRNVGKLTNSVDSFSKTLGALPMGSADSNPKATAAPGKSSQVLTAEWVEFEVMSPGLPIEKARRDVFDLVGPEARAARSMPSPVFSPAQKLDRSLALLGEVELLAVGHQIVPEYVAELRATRLVALRSFLLNVASGGASAATREPPSSAEPLPGPLFDFAVVRASWSAAPATMYFDRPNIFGYWKTIRADDKGGIHARVGYDIISNYLAARTHDAAAAFEARLAQGVVDTNAEALLIGGCASCEVGTNTAESFAGSAGRQHAWTVLAPRSQMSPALNVSSDVRARIGQDLSDGAVVVLRVPHGPADGDATWWRIDPRTGRTLGIGADGRGGQWAEYLTLLRVVVTTGFCLGAVVDTAGTRSVDSDNFQFAMCAIGAGFGFAGLAVPVGGTASVVLAVLSVLIQGIGGVIGRRIP